MDKDNVKSIISKIRTTTVNPFSVMEVCGSHTEAVKKYGIEELVKPNITLLSGPGCPVCVTSVEYIDHVIQLLSFEHILLSTFGDMIRVKGTKLSLMDCKEKGSDIRVLYSPLDVIELAKKNPEKEIVFLGVGFETTAPIIALAVKTAWEHKVQNLSFYIGLKRMEPILRYIFRDPGHGIDALICPGHVASVMGERYFEFVSKEYNIPAVIAGFEGEDIITALYSLTTMRNTKKYKLLNQYKRCVSYEGNRLAKALMHEVFEEADSYLRGIGFIDNAGLAIRSKYKEYDAAIRYQLTKESRIDDEMEDSCSCGEVLIGKKQPHQCPNYGKYCTPNHPMGPCMISTEGSCAIFYKYNGFNIKTSILALKYSNPLCDSRGSE
jgi:hydrogenase expression/formation protein HypD